MTIQDESTRTNRTAQTYNRYDRRQLEEVFAGLTMAANSTSTTTTTTGFPTPNYPIQTSPYGTIDEQSPLLSLGGDQGQWQQQQQQQQHNVRHGFFTQMSQRWLPNSLEHPVAGSGLNNGTNTTRLPIHAEQQKSNARLRPNGDVEHDERIEYQSDNDEYDSDATGDGVYADDNSNNNDDDGSDDDSAIFPTKNNEKWRNGNKNSTTNATTATAIPTVRFDETGESSNNQDPNGDGRSKTKSGGRWKGKVVQHITPSKIRRTNNSSSFFNRPRRRSFSRRLFLFLTEPTTSMGSAIFFLILVITICLSNIIMILQTMNAFQFTPSDCATCGGTKSYTFDDDQTTVVIDGHPCVCQPEPFEYLGRWLHGLMWFFAIEWSLRVLSYTPSSSLLQRRRNNFNNVIWTRLILWLQYLTSVPTLVDALAIWPHFFAQLPRGFLSLRLLRLFRVFSLVRLGQYNEMFVSLTNVMVKSFEYLKLMMLVLIFGGALFGSLIYWVEKGKWKYWEETGQYQFIRTTVDGVGEEISPFDSIPTSFWWFLVTATTVGYGDFYPTSGTGRIVGTFAMLAGVLVLAFPVSVFSDLWSEELKQSKGFKDLYGEDGDAQNPDSNPAADGVFRDVPLQSNMPASSSSQSSPWHGVNNNVAAFDDSSPYVVMEKSDLNSIVSSLHTIQENQNHIRSILRKYCNSDRPSTYA